MILKNYTLKNSVLKSCALKATVGTFVGLSSFAALAADGTEQPWVDMSDPTAVYSSATIGGGTEGIDLSASYGGYLSGVYKHRFTVAAKHDLDFYEVNYLLLNAKSNSGVTFDSSWSEDIRADGNDFDDVNDTSIGFFAKLAFMDNHLNFYPKVSVGYLWDGDIEDTTYVKFDATTRYTFNRMYWVGITPSYAHGFKGADLNEWEATIDAGVQLSDTFGFSVSANDDEEFTANVTFAF
ncbi:hypothetical protein [Psychromonas sp. SP041]|uniref:hypothetical protein n=1 Tax=Psychromonas sp. SP041 TaxID=1365007 RepID=UPI0004103812|nr:hypothetical protein [Psychromonas sp. SP041]